MTDKYGVSAREASERLRRVARLMASQPGDCDGPDCFLHPSGAAHHVGGCPWFDTFHGASHRLADALEPLAVAFAARVNAVLTAAERFWNRLRRL